MLLLLSFLIFFLPSFLLPLHLSSSSFRDSLQRQHFFHGVNVVFKSSPYHPDPSGPLTSSSFSSADLDNLVDWGFNSIRLGVMWPGVEPVRGEYNETYLHIMNEIVENAARKGVYTLLDFHQDVYSPKLCGEGIPLWATYNDSEAWQFPRPVQWTAFEEENGLPKEVDCQKYGWATFYMAEATGRAFQNLYNNVGGLRDALGLYWQQIAKNFKGKEHVLGYELMNEPWAGNHISNPLRLVPGYADRYNLGPFYDELVKYIREVDKEGIIFFESVTWDDFFPLGFTHPPGGHENANKSAISYHYYKEVNFNLDWQISARQKDGERLGVGLLCTEFDIFTSNFEEIKESLNIFDDRLQSWMGWDYKNDNFYYENFTSKSDFIKILSRTYAQVVAGTTIKMKFDPETSDFILIYQACAKCGETEIYLSEDLHYENGFEVSINDINFKWFQPLKNKVHIKVNGEEGEGKEVTVTIKRKKV